MVKLYESRAYLYRRYVVEKKTIIEIAGECKCSYQTVQRYLEKFGLIRNQRQWKKDK